MGLPVPLSAACFYPALAQFPLQNADLSPILSTTGAKVTQKTVQNHEIWGVNPRNQRHFALHA
jgi:hypothetical protein